MSHPGNFHTIDTPARQAAVIARPADRPHYEKFLYLLVFLLPPHKSLVPIVTVLPISPRPDDWETFLVYATEIFCKLSSTPFCPVICENRELMIARRAEARCSLLCNRAQPDPKFLFRRSNQKGGE